MSHMSNHPYSFPHRSHDFSQNPGSGLSGPSRGGGEAGRDASRMGSFMKCSLVKPEAAASQRVHLSQAGVCRSVPCTPKHGSPRPSSREKDHHPPGMLPPIHWNGTGAGETGSRVSPPDHGSSSIAPVADPGLIGVFSFRRRRSGRVHRLSAARPRSPCRRSVIFSRCVGKVLLETGYLVPDR